MAEYGVGDVLFFKEETWRTEHLYVVITDPSAHPRGLMLFPCVVSRSTFHQEVECELRPGDHPFIRHDSTIDYRRTKLVAAEDLDELIAQQLARRSPHPMEQDAVERIIAGARVSRQIRKDYKALLPPIGGPRPEGE